MIDIIDSEAFISLVGRLDTATAPQVEATLKNAIGSTQLTRIVIDATKLSYISSSGLRIILSLRKQCANTELHHVQKEVLSVLELTGISKLLTIC